MTQPRLPLWNHRHQEVGGVTLVVMDSVVADPQPQEVAAEIERVGVIRCQVYAETVALLEAAGRGPDLDFVPVDFARFDVLRLVVKVIGAVRFAEGSILRGRMSGFEPAM